LTGLPRKIAEILYHFKHLIKYREIKKGLIVLNLLPTEYKLPYITNEFLKLKLSAVIDASKHDKPGWHNFSHSIFVWYLKNNLLNTDIA